MIGEKRPWGYFEVLHRSENCIPAYQVKKLVVLPGHCTSMQSHNHRAEYWHIVEGIADVIKGGQRYVLPIGGRIDIPEKIVHRLSNTGIHDLVVIEVQVGDSVSEDDITRYADNYGRAGKI